MSSWFDAAALFVLIGFGAWLASHAIEALRPIPRSPEKLRWDPEIPVSYVELRGYTLRYIEVGSGPTLVLLHTLRTQLDLFEKVVPELAKHFTVFALDYPGHGYSEIPKARYDAGFFADSVEGFLEKLDLHDVTCAGVSIGGSISLIVASRQNPRLARVVAINPYDYANGRGLARSSWLGWTVGHAALVPVIGETVMRLRNFGIMKAVLRGGVTDPASIPPALLHEMYVVGNRRGHYGAFISLIRNSASWEAATKDYGRIRVPVLLVWGEQDWARPSERAHDGSLIPGAQAKTVARGGHFLPLDRPQEVVRLIKDFALPDAAPATPRS